MNSRLLCVLSLVSVAVAVFTSHALSQDQTPEAMAEMMKKMKALTTPNERHIAASRAEGAAHVARDLPASRSLGPLQSGG